MKKIIYYFPFIVFLALYIAVIFIGGLSFEYTVFLFLGAFLLAGLLLHKHIWLGGLLGIIPGVIFIENSMHNIKLGEQELMIGSCLVAYYLICMIYVFVKKGR